MAQAGEEAYFNHNDVSLEGEALPSYLPDHGNEFCDDGSYFCDAEEPLSDEGMDVDSEAEDFSDDNFYENWDGRSIDGIADVGSLNLKSLTVDEIKLLHFPDLNVAFSFYNFYAKMNGFSARRSKLRRNVNGDVTQQSFVCFRQGFREVKSYDESSQRKREPKPETRCGCQAEMRVHVHIDTGRWIVTYFQEVHNHEMLADELTFMLPGHRKMDASAIDQMNMMLKVGIKTPQIYASFVNTAGGFHNVPFLKRDMYNQIDKQRRLLGGDAMACLKFLQSTAKDDSGMFVRYLADKEDRLVHLFWSDKCSQLDYHIFGDVLAFDATYRKNKYMCPLVVFSGVNHHNQTIVFAAALISNENEDTYTWLLQQFLECMNGKAPQCVITDGHGAMKKAIESVLPSAYHRLCAWHLIRNATANLGNPTFTSEFKRCMLFDYEISEFHAFTFFFLFFLLPKPSELFFFLLPSISLATSGEASVVGVPKIEAFDVSLLDNTGIVGSRVNKTFERMRRRRRRRRSIKNCLH
ncbi:protein FAR1-RELATED SEQUENCE 5 [Arachis duranensis]|uniref:Protein FAR1-RELATED SEQUENCE 5 n=1 Tax=Arachis duranensis TaxID=130453 RepID=A0A9C6TDB6_ARADU|nr:protein FAR1-RELATED SEQUENCE 5 [Arachis duranensis]XP_052108193.1 protein FAR1-RELATED SEQUENCE 5 [Arachis duranensis]